MSALGTSVARRDLRDKVTGLAAYTGDVKLPGMLYGRLKRAEIAHARIARIDASKALALPGVKAVLTYKDVPRVLHAGSPWPRAASLAKDQYILDEKVRFWGEAVAAVAATSDEIAARAVDLIEVEYEPLPAVFTVEEALAPGAPLLHEVGPGGNLVANPVKIERGDVEAGFAEADLILEGEFDLGRPSPAYMEPNVCLCHWDGNGTLSVWISTQTSFMVRGIMAEVLGLPLNKVRVLVDHMGGGFGAKQDLFQHEFLCALLSRQTQKPVRMELTRKESFVGGRSRHPAKIWLRQGFRKDGTITARQARVTYNSGAYASHGPGVTVVGTSALTSLYRCPNVRLEGRCVYTNNPIAGAFRGYGVVQTYYALDIQMDEAAEALGIDPLEIRRLNAVREGDIAPSGHPVVGHGLEACIARGSAEAPWAERTDGGGIGPIRRGRGMGCEMHGSSAYPGIKEQGNAIVKMNEDGSVVLLTGAADLGTGAHTALAQIVAEELGLPFPVVSVRSGDTDFAPWDIGAFASHTTYLVGRASQMAAAKIKEQVLERAATSLQAKPADLAIADGVIFVKDDPSRELSITAAVGTQSGYPAANLIASAAYMPTKSYSFAAHFAEVAVDTETGRIAVEKVTAVHDIGKVVHPVAAAGQVEGGIQQGIGHTLTEDHLVDQKTGRSLNPSFVDYKMPLAKDMPPINTILLEAAPDPGGPFGAKGVGEDPIVAIGPAIANAIYDAIGVRFHCYPITPEKVLTALREQAEKKASA